MDKKTFLMILPAALLFSTMSIADTETTSKEPVSSPAIADSKDLEVTIDEFNKYTEHGKNAEGVLTDEALSQLIAAIDDYENDHFNGLKIKDAAGNEKKVKKGVSDKNSHQCSYNRTDKSVVIRELDGKLYAFNYWGEWYYEIPESMNDIKAHAFRLPSKK